MSIGRQVPKPCEACGKPLPIIRKRTRRFCDKSCAWVATKGPDYNARLALSSAIKSGETQRGRGAGRTYRKFMGQHEHRIVAERLLGRPLRDKEIVHHIDGDKRNNDPANLEVITQGEHMRRHGLALPGVRPKGEPWKYRWRKADVGHL